MARDPKFDHLYQAYQLFKERCLLNDSSILWPDKKLWIIENLNDLKARFIDSAILDSAKTFHEKLAVQMQDAKPELWGLLSDVFYVYYLPSSFIKFESKKREIETAANFAGYSIPHPEDKIWDGLKRGFSRTGQRYHQKYAQFWLIILLAIEVKNTNDPKAILDHPEQFQKKLDTILESIPNKIDRASDMRHALLYLAFPDKYENIISTSDKDKIAKVYADEIDNTLTSDLDAKIKFVREAITPKYDLEGDYFNFYHPKVKKDWRHDKPIIGNGDDSTDDEGNDIESEVDEDILRSLDLFSHTKNIILYGAPGTGKTYIAKKVSEQLVKPQLEKTPSESINLQLAIKDLSFHDIIALGMHHFGMDKTYSVTEIEKFPVIETRFNMTSVNNPKNAIWSYLQSHADPESKTVKTARRWPPYLFDKDKSSRWGLTNEGREYVQENLMSNLELIQPGKQVDFGVDVFIEWATFHQSYSYEDFIEGLRPIPSEEDPGSVSYSVVPGVFRKVCSKAVQDSQNKYVLVIDEINRGNIAKILGELITLIEDDKRGDMVVTLPYSGDLFHVPSNLYIIGTMNTADRSIALLDVALRRRFAFVEILPRPDLLAEADLELEGAQVNLMALLNSLNKAIIKFIDKDHQIGHSYLLKVARAPEASKIKVLEFVWNNQIMPLLEEYFYSQNDKLLELLAPFQEGVELEEDLPESNLIMGRAEGEDLIIALSKFD